MDLVPVLGILAPCVFLPAIILGFIYLTKRNKNEIELMRCRKETLELEVRKEELRVQVLREESRLLDRQISNRIALEDQGRETRS